MQNCQISNLNFSAIAVAWLSINYDLSKTAYKNTKLNENSNASLLDFMRECETIEMMFEIQYIYSELLI